MTLTERTRLLAFGLFGWSASMFSAAEAANDLVRLASPVQAAIMTACFATALLPGRTARFS